MPTLPEAPSAVRTPESSYLIFVEDARRAYFDFFCEHLQEEQARALVAEKSFEELARLRMAILRGEKDRLDAPGPQ